MVLSRLGARVRALAVAAVLAGAASVASVAIPSADAAIGHAELTLGDSVPFGFITQAGFEYGNPHNFVGYSDYTAQALRLAPANAACPGETTAHFLSLSGADNGCGTFRAHAPLHVSYSGTQMDFATAFLRAHRTTRLVTVQLGANDLFLLQHACNNDPTCIGNGLPAVLGSIGSNMNAILGGLRATGYRGVIEVVNYYSLDYTDPFQTGVSQLLDQVLAGAAAAHGAVVANVFSAFATAAGAAGGHTCMAGLLNASPANQFTCDVHPSQSGHQLMAQTVESTFFAAGEDG